MQLGLFDRWLKPTPKPKPRAAPPLQAELLIGPLTVQLQRKRIRTLRLGVYPPPGPSVRVSAPLRASQAEIQRFVLSKLAWVQAQQARLAAQAAAAPMPATEAEKKALRRWCRQQLQLKVPPLIEAWQPRLGVQVKSWGLRQMRSRWGSCNTRTAHLSLSLELARKEDDLLEYIVVHEMLHLLEASHGPRFKALMDQHYPAWKQSRKRLNGTPTL